jgi:hypothetical protein
MAGRLRDPILGGPAGAERDEIVALARAAGLASLDPATR